MEKTVIYFLSVLAVIQSNPLVSRQSTLRQKTSETVCSNVLNFNNVFYSLEEQKNISGIPADMSIHWKTGKVFFTLISEEMKMSLQTFEPNGELSIITVDGLGQSSCVDNRNDIIYLATDNGVYKYKFDGTLELYTALGDDVMYIAVNREGTVMYIATWPQNRVHKITKNGQTQEIFTAIPNGHGLTVDSKNNIYFVATKTSYILKNGFTIPIKIKGLPNDKMTGVFITKTNEVYAMDEKSNLYLIDPDNTNAKHLGTFNLSGVNSFAMDANNNVLIGIKGAILKYNASEMNPCLLKENAALKDKRHNKRRKHRKHTTSTTEATTSEELDKEYPTNE